MSKSITKEFIQEIISSADIINVISRFVDLKKSGKNHKGCCPFHNEKTPSFFVNHSKGFFHCFGCQESGDSLTFVKKINNLTFVDAVEYLAEMQGKVIEYENFSKEDQEREKQYDKCLSLLDVSSKYYRWNLSESDNKATAINYLKSRGIDGKTVKLFGIGYALDSWDGVCNFAKNARIDENIVLESGLAIKSDKGRIYDRFRSRIMFPIRNIQGRVVGFGGRAITKDDGVKYINSPETIVFKKNTVLYGLYEYRQKKQLSNDSSGSIVVVEGYMDVVGLAMHGFYDAVATLGTAFSSQHAKILFRESHSVILCFDGDTAGQKAALRTIKLVLSTLDSNKKLKVLTLPDSKDPDDYIKEFGLDNFNNQINNAEHISEYLIRIFTQNKNLTQAEGKTEVVESMRDFFSEVETNIYTESIIATVSVSLGFTTTQLKNLVMNKALRTEQSVFAPKKQKILNNLTLEQRMISEMFTNVLIFRDILKTNNFEILATSENLDILYICLKKIQEDTYSIIEVVGLIQMLTEKYPNYRDYLFDLLGFGLENSLIKKHVNSELKKTNEEEYTDGLESYKNEIVTMLRRLEINSVRERINEIKQKPIKTNDELMELRFLLNKLI